MPSVVYHCATPDPAQALLFGNGSMGGTVHMPDGSLYILVSRCDNWNEKAKHGSVAAVRIRGRGDEFTGAARLRQECSLNSARIDIAAHVDDGTVHVSLVCLRTADCLAIEIEDQRAQPGTWLVTLEDWHDGASVTEVRPGIIATSHRNGTSCYAERCRRQGIDSEALRSKDPILGRAWSLAVGSMHAASIGGSSLRLMAGKKNTIFVSTSCVLHGDPIRQVEAIIVEAEEKLPLWMSEHGTWWAEFWDGSSLDLHSTSGDAEYESRLYAVSLYGLACGMGGAYPVRFNGGPYLLQKDSRYWDAGFWGQNMRLVYLPMIAAGRPSFLRDYIDWHVANAEIAEIQARTRFSASGMAWGETQTCWGLCEIPSSHGMRYHYTNNLELLLLIDGHLRSTGDHAYFKERCYPIVRGVIEFYMSLSSHGPDGRWHLSPASSIETWEQVIDPLPDMAGLRWLSGKAIAWAEACGEERATIERWKAYFGALADIPVGRWKVESVYESGIHAAQVMTESRMDAAGIYMPAAGGVTDRSARTNMENAELYVLFPWGVTGMDAEPAERGRLASTWHHRTWRLQNNGWSQDAIHLARMGWSDDCHRTLTEHARYNQRFPNGMFISPAAPEFHGMLTSTPYLDASGAHVLALQEMLLQSHDGVIRFAPAAPDTWSGSCRLNTWDGVRVDMRLIRGIPTTVTLTPPSRGVACMRIRNHRRSVMVCDGGLTQPGQDLVLKDCRAPVCISWTGDETLVEPQRLPVPDVIWPDFRARGPLSAYEHGHWHDERGNHGQIGLCEDGLFPATRQSQKYSR
jgi:hypothetical protein